jgi:hypothetical protein
MKLKIDISLHGDKLKIKSVEDMLKRYPKIKCKFLPVWEIDELQKRGKAENIGKPHGSGFCWILGITVANANKLFPHLKSLNVDEFTITVQQRDIKCQEGYWLDRDFIQLAARMDAYVEICNFKRKNK